MTDDTTNWTELREFFGVDIGRSFALSWQLRDASLLIDLDLYVKPEHPGYEAPRPAEKACYRAAILEFPGCLAAQRGGHGKTAGRHDSLAQIEPGAISGLMRTGEGRYELSGAFGVVTISSDRPLLRIKDPDQ